MLNRNFPFECGGLGANGAAARRRGGGGRLDTDMPARPPDRPLSWRHVFSYQMHRPLISPDLGTDHIAYTLPSLSPSDSFVLTRQSPARSFLSRFMGAGVERGD